MKVRKYLLILGAAVLAACSSNATKGNADEDSTAVAELTAVADIDENEAEEVAPQDSDDEAEMPFELNFTLKNLLVLLNHYNDYELAEQNGVELIYEAGNEDGEIECIETAYGRDVAKAGREVVGYSLKATSTHAFYFKITLDTSTHACLAFVNKEDADNFIAEVEKAASVSLDGRKYYVHPKVTDGQKYYYLETVYDKDDFETRFVLYPLEKKDGFYLREIEVYV